MKKILSVILCLVIGIIHLLPISAFSAGCSHSYEAESIAPTCISRGYTLYTCSLCGDSYKESEALSEFPETFYFVLEGEKNGNILTVYLRQDNNTGIWSTRATVYYNVEALNPISAEVGEVWEGTSESVTINRDSGYLRHFTSSSDYSTNNYKNGVVFKAEFEILAPVDEWGVSLEIRARDIINSDSIKQPFSQYNTVMLGYSDEHSYKEGVVTANPTITSEGEISYTCALCEAVKTEKLPSLPRYNKCDVDGNGKINLQDCFYIKRYMKGYCLLSEQELDAADTNDDGKINSVDIMQIKTAIKNGQFG